MTSKPIRFLLVSTHAEQTTGYAKVSYNILKQLSTLYPVVKTFHYGFQRSPVRGPAPMRPIEHVIQYDAANNEEPRAQGFGFAQLASYIDTVSPDIVMIYNDPIVVNQFLDAITNVPKNFKLWVYLDQVYQGCDQGLLRNIESRSDHIFCFTDKWLQYLKTRIPTTERPLSVLEHGVDPTVFFRLPDAERISMRKQLNLPSDAIVFLNMNRNSERKRLDLSVMAFARLLQDCPDKPLYLLFVTTLNPQGGAHYNPIQIYLNELGVLGLDTLVYGQRVVCLDTAPPKMFDDKTINAIYNACDYGLNSANGEGFGLCQLEHLATGAPQVVVDVGDYRAFMDESVSEIVQCTSYSYLGQGAGIGNVQKTCTANELAEAMKRILENKNTEGCLTLANRRPWSRVCDQFLELVAGCSTF